MKLSLLIIAVQFFIYLGRYSSRTCFSFGPMLDSIMLSSKRLASPRGFSDVVRMRGLAYITTSKFCVTP